MAKFIIRPAAREDAGAIRALINNVRINPISLNWKRFIVAVTAQGILIGCGQIKFHSDGSRELASIAVWEQARGLGAARGIIDELLARETERPIYLMCRARLVKFYNKFGFYVIAPKEMTPYFKRISRIESIFNSKAHPEDRLRIMRID